MKAKNKLKRLIALLSLILAIAMTLGSLSATAANYLTTTTVINLNSAPVSENLSLETYRSVSVTDTFRCVDPEGDMVTYSVSKKPSKGDVTVDGDKFTYTPLDGKKGKDTFTYVAIDTAGNISNEATVTISIKKQATDVFYADMSGNDAWYAATKLAEEGIFVGEKLGSSYVFRPDEAVTRGEFLAMCMNLTGEELLDGITRTGFFDDEDIPMWQKPYVTTALVSDIISGKNLGDGKIVFSANDNITFAEATVMLNNALAITDVYCDSVDEAYPTWAYQACVNLASCNIVSSDSDGETLSQMSRSDAAKMLLGALNVKSSRTDSSLLSWAK